MSIRFQCTCGRAFTLPDSAAGKHAQCRDCGLKFTIPQPPGGPIRPVKSSRPAAPRRKRPAHPPVEDVPVARLIEEDDVPMAQLAAPAAAQRPGPGHRARHRAPALGGARITAGLATLAILWMAVDAIVCLAQGVQTGLKGIGWLHAMWLFFLVIGFFIAAAAARGSRFCIGVLLGGAFRGVVNGVVIFVVVSMAETFSLTLPRWMMVYGWIAVGLGAVYIVLLLGSPGTRHHLVGHEGSVAGAAVVAFLIGAPMAATAMPSPLMLFTRFLAQPKELGNIARQLNAPELIGAMGKKEISDHAHSNLALMSRAMASYVNSNENYFPRQLGEIVSTENCPPVTFVCPGKPAPAYDHEKRVFTGAIDVHYLFADYHLLDLPSDNDNLRQLIVCYTDPNCHFGDGSVVMRPPVGGTGFKIVEWLDKDFLAEELAYTREWIRRNPHRPVSTRVKKPAANE